jgi:hypothetical protein
MSGEFKPVWGAMHRDLWVKLALHDSAPPELFSELYRELAPRMVTRPAFKRLAEASSDARIARSAFARIRGSQLRGERTATDFLESVHVLLDDLGGHPLSTEYRRLLELFIHKFSLRYQICEPCILCPTLPGMFASMLDELRAGIASDPHLTQLLDDFEHSVQTLRLHESQASMKSCLSRQVNLLEGLGRAHHGVSGRTLGTIADQLGTWPHEKVRDALKCLYGFASDYPGIRHGGTASNQLRPLSMRDLLAGSILLAGFTPYVAECLDPKEVYRRA